MRLSVFIGVLVFSLSVHGQSPLERTIDLSIQDLPITEALKVLSDSCDCPIAFSKNFFPGGLKQTLQLKKVSVGSALSALLTNTGISWKVSGNRILLFRDRSQTFTISGYIRDASSGERLIAATIYAPEYKIGATSNEYGYFSLTLPMGTVNLQYNYVGYQALLETVEMRNDVQKDIRLVPSITMKEIIVTPPAEESFNSTADLDRAVNISNRFIRNNPSLGGSPDIVRSLQILPGVHGGIDGIGGLFVRGGNNSHNLLLLDGVPVYIPFHAMGIFSAVNPATVHSTRLYKGSFPARYGGRLASVLDVHTLDGNNNQWHGEVSANLVNANVMVEGPLKKDKATLMIAGRYAPRGFLMDPVYARTIFQDDDTELTSRFHDINLKVNYRISPKDRLYASFFSGEDALKRSDRIVLTGSIQESKLDFGWNNTIAALRWNHLFHKKLFANTTVTYSRFNYHFHTLDYFIPEVPDFGEQFYFLGNSSQNQDLGIKIDLDYLPGPGHTFRFGGRFSNRAFRPVMSYHDATGLAETVNLDPDIDDLARVTGSDVKLAKEAAIYGEDAWTISERWSAIIGMRVSSFFPEDRNHLNVEPRLRLQYRLNPSFMTYAAASRMVQYLHLVANSAIRLPNDLWVPSTGLIRPQKSDMAELGFRLSPHPTLTLSLAGYYKDMRNLYSYPQGYGFLQIVNETKPETYLIRGIGQVAGLDLQAVWQIKQSGIMVSYTLSENTRKYNALNGANPFPHAYDHRHQVSLLAWLAIGNHFRFSLNSVYKSANPVLHLNNIDYEIGISEAVVFPEESDIRYVKRGKPYDRTDITASYAFGKKTGHEIKLGVYNVFDSKNIAYYNLIVELSSGDLKTEPVFAIPLTPTLQYTWRF